MFAHALAKSLAELTRVTLLTTSKNGVDSPKFEHLRTLSLKPAADAALLNSLPADAWLTVNAGLTPLARRLKKPLFAYYHGNDFLQPWIPCGPRWLEIFQRPYAATFRHSLRKHSIRRSICALSTIFCNSTHTAFLIQSQFGAPPSRIAVRPPGVDEDFFSVPEPDQSKSLRLLTVATLSRYARRKNIDAVLAAVRLLKPSLDVMFTVVGGGDDLLRLRQLARELGVQEQTLFKGHVDRAELLRAYSEADLFVLASKATPDDVEGFGMVYMEASAAGTPVICSREGGATDAVEDGLNGILIERSSPNLIAAGILRFARERDLFIPSRIKSFAAKYRWNLVAEDILEQMRSVS